MIPVEIINPGIPSKSRRIPQESIGNPSEMEAVFRPEVFRIFFRWIPANCLYFPVGTGRKSSETIRESSGWNTAFKIRRKSIGSGRFPAYMFDLG